MTKKRSIPNSLKSQVVRSYLKREATVAELAEKYEIKPSQIYAWEKQLLENAEITFERKNCRVSGAGAVSRMDKKMKSLEQILGKKDSIISTLAEELIKAKKLTGI